MFEDMTLQDITSSPVGCSKSNKSPDRRLWRSGAALDLSLVQSPTIHKLFEKPDEPAVEATTGGDGGEEVEKEQSPVGKAKDSPPKLLTPEAKRFSRPKGSPKAPKAKAKGKGSPKAKAKAKGSSPKAKAKGSPKAKAQAKAKTKKALAAAKAKSKAKKASFPNSSQKSLSGYDEGAPDTNQAPCLFPGLSADPQRWWDFGLCAALCSRRV